ncbi:hypothetical protein Tco_0966453 [Tanacetum coccineum]
MNNLRNSMAAVFTVNLHHDGYFISNPLKYVYGSLKVIDDIQFEEMPVEKDMEDFMKVGYDNGFQVDLYTDINGYDVLEMISEDYLFPPNLVDPDYESEELDEDPENIEEEDPDDDLIDAKYKIKKGVKYPSYNLETAWNEFEPILGMKFETLLKLKNALADYGVKHGYKLWYYRGDSNSLLMYCGRDVELGRCADSHKGLIEAVRTWLPQAEHRHCTRHMYANFKRKWSGLHYKRLFWGAATSTIEQGFVNKMKEIRQLDEEAFKYLMERDPRH